MNRKSSKLFVGLDVHLGIWTTWTGCSISQT
jgi:hypothetical protein